MSRCRVYSTTHLLTLLTYSPQNRQQRRLRAADAAGPFSGRTASVYSATCSGRFQVEVVRPVVFVFAVLGRVVAADLRAGFVDAAAVVVLQVLARRCGPAGTKSSSSLKTVARSCSKNQRMNSKSANVFGRFDRQGEIAAALGRAVVAEALRPWGRLCDEASAGRGRWP